MSVEPVLKGLAIYSFGTHLPWYMSNEEVSVMSTAFSADVKLTASVLRLLGPLLILLQEKITAFSNVPAAEIITVFLIDNFDELSIESVRIVLIPLNNMRQILKRFIYIYVLKIFSSKFKFSFV